MLEIERKFLVSSTAFKYSATSRHHIAQGYLNSNPDRTVRIRIMGEIGFITIKGKSNDSGTTRFEWETEISLLEARQLLKLCEDGTIEKMRYHVPVGKHLFEIDEFIGENDGLVLAELELKDEAEVYESPDWLGLEVTGDIRYYNSHLSKNPFKKWL
ncbi:CYTH domain-containing protein [Flavobacterium silvaticum]|uniref:CYTH domain-containing protein n=1 Tax=Flavobacterium silvaticum TaxID=1852020 RepID=A0A972JF65_9FLAO|nr:CYTH domain-containing protein [Flavobacterium silvaticum]NMH27629.1 CYTH domain-containing protein [Flavobacterium silvaticum]